MTANNSNCALKNKAIVSVNAMEVRELPAGTEDKFNKATIYSFFAEENSSLISIPYTPSQAYHVTWTPKLPLTDSVDNQIWIVAVVLGLLLLLNIAISVICFYKFGILKCYSSGKENEPELGNRANNATDRIGSTEGIGLSTHASYSDIRTEENEYITQSTSSQRRGSTSSTRSFSERIYYSVCNVEEDDDSFISAKLCLNETPNHLGTKIWHDILCSSNEELAHRSTDDCQNTHSINLLQQRKDSHPSPLLERDFAECLYATPHRSSVESGNHVHQTNSSPAQQTDAFPNTIALCSDNENLQNYERPIFNSNAGYQDLGSLNSLEFYCLDGEHEENTGSLLDVKMDIAGCSDGPAVSNTSIGLTVTCESTPDYDSLRRPEIEALLQDHRPEP